MNPQDFSKYKNLSTETKKNLVPTEEFSKSQSIQQLDKIQHDVIQKAKQSGDQRQIKEADRFAKALSGEQRFIRYSK